ncbi:uncharacterized protein LOC144642787 isoform X1 [Oculina patagonica]
MFRLLFVLILVFILRSFASTQNQSTKKVSVNGTQQNQCGKTSIKECCNCRDGRDGRDGQNGKDGRDGQNGLQGKDGRDGRDGKNGLKGKKGEPGSSSNPFHGAIKFSYTADTCSLHTAGTVRYSSSQNALQLCDGSVWLSVLTAGKGHVASNPGSHCLDILNSGKDGRDGRNGKNGLKGKKGEPGSSSNPSHGAIKFSYTADTCSLHTAGTVRYSSSQNALQLCDGSAWLSVLTAGKGHVASNPGSHCLDILNSGKDGRDGRDGKNGLKGVKGEQGIRGSDGINGTKGQKGESGLAGKSPQGAIKFSDTAENCSLHTAGTVRYNTSQNALQLCNGRAWLPLVTAWKGHVANNPGHHCLDILNSGQSRGSGLYWIDPNGGSTDDSFQAFCDMETERGGWTLVATKVSPTFLFIKTGFSTLAAKTKYADAASHIHPAMGDWEEVMFRFADVDTIRAIYSRTAGAPQNNKREFDEFLMGKSASLMKDVYGFYKYSPAVHNKRSPAVGFVTISRLHFFTTRGISEAYAGTDKWIDMWNGGGDGPDGSNNYVTSDDSKARGRKCIAGYCYLNKPIWVMVR